MPTASPEDLGEPGPGPQFSGTATLAAVFHVGGLRGRLLMLSLPETVWKPLSQVWDGETFTDGETEASGD